MSNNNHTVIKPDCKQWKRILLHIIDSHINTHKKGKMACDAIGADGNHGTAFKMKTTKQRKQTNCKQDKITPKKETITNGMQCSSIAEADCIHYITFKNITNR